MDLKNKVAIITGASSGIGEATAHELDSAGVSLVLTARNQDKLEKLASKLTNATFFASEVTEPDLPQHLLETALNSFGRVDALVNNAGVMVVGTVETIDIEEICQMVRINVESAFRLAYFFAKHFKQQSNGFIVNLSSISGTTNYPTMAAYCGTKHAIESFTDCLRLELAGSGVGVGCVEPGKVATNLYQNWSDEQKQIVAIEQPLVAQDIAKAIRFILEQPSNINIGRLLITPAHQSA
ncbi:short-chain dehydrogenase/reductase SDR [Nostoc sp. NIES-3756]|uniref:SDR family oxidoreductase n=1 Tax=Nostoc sp. NIES-3756 TaxID=1751286 RepID=UPI0007211FE2|nr:SDR family oxidoreductase [Nostoc sp. NIES-3756]BAT53137.1 short-chain dehydrogenase/reductase SDR [Nostoc sp. NIES-3756]